MTIPTGDAGAGRGARVLRAVAMGSLALTLFATGAAGGFGALGPIAALADDDDDGGGGGGRGGGRGGGGFGGGSIAGGDATGRSRGDDLNPGGGSLLRLFRGVLPRAERPRVRRRARQETPRRQRSRPARVAAAAPPAQFAPNEIVALGLTDDEIDTLAAAGYAVIARDDVELVAATAVRLRVPPGTSLEEARTEVRAINAVAVADFNHFYRPDQDAGATRLDDCDALSCAAAQLIAWPVRPGATGSCAAGARIGLIDTGINPEHEALAAGSLEIVPFDTAADAEAPSGRQHGTAVAAILLGDARSRTPGLLPDAEVVAVDAFFATAEGSGSPDERTDAYTLVRAMDAIAAHDVGILNMSLAGPANSVLETMVAQVHADDIVMVASAGNGGPQAEPAYPAGYPGVVAVTAVDRGGTVYRRAGRGAHIDLAAPGVEVWTAASVSGARPKTGTSFATPFVTAAAALAAAGLGLAGHDAVFEALAVRARDLGEPGRDDVYGFGLIQADGLCRPVSALPSEARTAGDS